MVPDWACWRAGKSEDDFVLCRRKPAFADLYLKENLRSRLNPQGRSQSGSGGGAEYLRFSQRPYRDIGRGRQGNCDFDSESYVMERSLVADLAVIHAWKADREGNSFTAKRRAISTR
jgi:acyl CoA:acetate/3-ketoacid CoA transferase alpha subunit